MKQPPTCSCVATSTGGTWQNQGGEMNDEYIKLVGEEIGVIETDWAPEMCLETLLRVESRTYLRANLDAEGVRHFRTIQRAFSASGHRP
jgi:hypothetical protein